MCCNISRKSNQTILKIRKDFIEKDGKVEQHFFAFFCYFVLFYLCCFFVDGDGGFWFCLFCFVYLKHTEKILQIFLNSELWLDLD